MKCFQRFPVFIICLFLFTGGCREGNKEKKILVFTHTADFYHKSIPAGSAALIALGEANGFRADTTSDPRWIQEDTLKNYAAVVFLNTTGNALNNVQEADFERYIQAGGGFVGIHAAADTEYDWGWYGRLVGAYFISHPRIQEAVLQVVDSQHMSTTHLLPLWKRKDEWYNYKKISPAINVLIKIDESTYNGGTNGEYHPVAWYHDYDGGRAFYTGLGHTDESYTEPAFIQHLLGGIQYAMGSGRKLNYAKAKTPRVPDEDRFSKTVLVKGRLSEPVELAILPNLDVLIAQRKGEIMLYKEQDKKLKQVGFLNVYHKTNTNENAEEGLLGMQADPDFKENNFIYVFYSPADTSVNRLSRFTFMNDSIDIRSEKIILEFYSQREICCHTGGSIAFGKDRMLYVSTGDNTTPFRQRNETFVNNGFAPLNDRPGRQHLQYDARRSAANTNDLRGKIIRIKMNVDGSYEIPPGNLFPQGTNAARPEIYVMGNRNPYRISVDPQNNFLYWGDVGPDARADSLETRGPRGYDEINQARQAGFFGWPLFAADNIPYYDYDYDSGISGKPFYAAAPVNHSRNNTGLQNLPPAQPAFIWYPSAPSKDFPQAGSGGRTAMAGPVYYTALHPQGLRLPGYYNKKFFIYDWIRDWIKVVTLQENGDFDKMEPFMSNTRFAGPIDMEVAPDGRLYILEYGKGWFSTNEDAGLSRIEYNSGNRPPAIQSIQLDKTTGALPLTIKASVTASDPESDPLEYIWHMGEHVSQTTTPSFEYTFTQPGDHSVYVEVRDNKKAFSQTNIINVYAGNEAPVVDIMLDGNHTFYFPGEPVKYSVKVSDREDGNEIDPSRLVVLANYMDGSDKAQVSTDQDVFSASVSGKNIMMSLDCKSCHDISKQSIGPSFSAIAERYHKKPGLLAYLSDKIINGSVGVWGEVQMTPHPELKEADARQIAYWIQSLSQEEKGLASLPVSGTLSPTLNNPVSNAGLLYISASYTDKAAGSIKPLTSGKQVVLKNSKMFFSNVSNKHEFSINHVRGLTYMGVPKATGWFSIDSIDLTAVKRIDIEVAWLNYPVTDYVFDVYIDGPDKTKIGTLAFDGKNETIKVKQPVPDRYSSTIISGALLAVTDKKKHNLYIVSRLTGDPKTRNIELSAIQFYSK